MNTEGHFAIEDLTSEVANQSDERREPRKKAAFHQ